MCNYLTVAAPACAEFIEKRSRFIGSITPVATQEQALAFIKEISLSHKEASHNAFAYRLQNGQKRYSDDGEPSSTAGVPALQVLEKANLTDVCVVVTRYFGGTLLGGGGLVRAYSHSVTIAMEAARIVTMRPSVRVVIVCDYGLYGKLSHLLLHLDAVTEESVFSDKTKVQIRLLEEKLESLEKSLQELSSGQVSGQVIERFYGEA